METTIGLSTGLLFLLHNLYKSLNLLTSAFSYSYDILKIFIYLFSAALGLRCCARAFSSCGERGLLFVAVRGLLTAMASLVAEHGLQVHGLQ